MKKTGLLLLITTLLVTALLSSPLCAKQLAMVKGEDDVVVKVFLMTDPPVVGSNNIRIELEDDKGNTITDAKIKLYYSMEPMKGMAPMSKKVRPVLEGDHYNADVKTRMKGHWNLTIKIKRKNADLLEVKTKFSVK
ncbi:MAG: FixH family protein [Desulfobacula sp.]|nr:FixH family protein [Desulfobacula sp.]